MSSTNTFLKEATTLIRAGAGLVVVSTREPHLAASSIQALADSRNTAYQMWSVNGGFHVYSRTSKGVEVTNEGHKPTEFSMAIRATKERAPTVESTKKGFFVFHGAHHFIGEGGKVKGPAVSQAIRDMAQELPQTKVTVFLLVHPGFEIPSELEADLVYMEMDLPGADDRRTRAVAVLNELYGFNPNFNKYTDEQLDRIVRTTGGMTTGELDQAISRSMMEYAELLGDKSENGVPFEDFMTVLQNIKTEVVKRNEVLELYPAEDMSNVGGLDLLKEWVSKRRRAFTVEAREAGVDAPKGVALIGPPGTGKSLAAKAIASELGLSLIRFDVARVFNSLVGSTEARIRAVLKVVEAMGPCVLMIDEIDKALGNSHGSSGDSGVSQRVLGAILTWMNDNKSGAFVVVTANRVDNLPAELLRKGRLDEVFSVTLPNAKDRESILRIHLRKRKQDASMDLTAAVAASEGYVPAELEAAVAEAVVEAFHTGNAVSADLIVAQLGRPLSQTHAEQFSAMRVWAENNARPASIPDEVVEQSSTVTVAPAGVRNLGL